MGTYAGIEFLVPNANLPWFLHFLMTSSHIYLPLPERVKSGLDWNTLHLALTRECFWVFFTFKGHIFFLNNWREFPIFRRRDFYFSPGWNPWYKRNSYHSRWALLVSAGYKHGRRFSVFRTNGCPWFDHKTECNWAAYCSISLLSIRMKLKSFFCGYSGCTYIYR